MEQEPAPAPQPQPSGAINEAAIQQSSSQPLAPEVKPSQPLAPEMRPPSQPLISDQTQPQPLPSYQPLPQWAPSAPYPSAPYPSQSLPPQITQPGYMPTQPPPPQWQPQQPARSKWKAVAISSLLLNALLLIVVIASLGAAKGNTSNNTSNTPANTATSSVGSSSNTPSVPTASTSQHYKIGQTVAVGNSWQVTINSATTSQGSGDDLPPKAGNTYLIIEATLKNLQSKAEPLSTLLDFELHDPQGNHYTEAFLFSINGPDGTVEAGGLAHGKWGYEVPNSIHAFTLLFSDDFGQTVVVWDISV